MKSKKTNFKKEEKLKKDDKSTKKTQGSSKELKKVQKDHKNIQKLKIQNHPNNMQRNIIGDIASQNPASHRHSEHSESLNHINNPIFVQVTPRNQFAQNQPLETIQIIEGNNDNRVEQDNQNNATNRPQNAQNSPNSQNSHISEIRSSGADQSSSEDGFEQEASRPSQEPSRHRTNTSQQSASARRRHSTPMQLIRIERRFDDQEASNQRSHEEDTALNHGQAGRRQLSSQFAEISQSPPLSSQRGNRANQAHSRPLSQSGRLRRRQSPLPFQLGTLLDNLGQNPGVDTAHTPDNTNSVRRVQFPPITPTAQPINLLRAPGTAQNTQNGLTPQNMVRVQTSFIVTRNNRKCILNQRGHLLGAIFPYESKFSFYTSGILYSGLILGVILAFSLYDPNTTHELFVWRYLFLLRLLFQVAKLFDSIILLRAGLKAKPRVFHYSLLSVCHFLYFLGFVIKLEAMTLVSLILFIYVLLINFLGIEHVNRFETIFNEILMMSIYGTIFSEEKNWGVALLLLTMGSIVGLILLIAVTVQPGSCKTLPFLILGYATMISCLFMVYSMNAFVEQGSWYRFMVLPCPVLWLLCYVVAKKIIYERWRSASNQRVLGYFLSMRVPDLRTVQRAVLRRRVRNRRRVAQGRRAAVMQDAPRRVVKRKRGAFDRMKGWFRKGPSLFARIVEGDLEALKASKNKNKDADEGLHDSLCVICMDAKSDTFYAPCSHTGVCKNCALAMLKKNSRCPICRGKVDGLVFYEVLGDGSGGYREKEYLDVRLLEEQSRGDGRRAPRGGRFAGGPRMNLD